MAGHSWKRNPVNLWRGRRPFSLISLHNQHQKRIPRLETRCKAIEFDQFIKLKALISSCNGRPHWRKIRWRTLFFRTFGEIWKEPKYLKIFHIKLYLILPYYNASWPTYAVWQAEADIVISTSASPRAKSRCTMHMAPKGIIDRTVPITQSWIMVFRKRGLTHKFYNGFFTQVTSIPLYALMSWAKQDQKRYDLIFEGIIAI